MKKKLILNRFHILMAAFFALAILAESALAEGLLEVDVAGKPLVNYQSKPLSNPKGGDRFKGSDFIHPLKTPSGFVLTDIQPGDHLHHFGLWWPWKYVSNDGRKVLFWELQKGEGIIKAREAKKTEDGFVAESVYIDRKAKGGPEVWIEETVDAKVSDIVESPARGYFLDLAIRHVVAGQSPLEIVKYRYSGFALRGTAEWNRDNSTVLTSEGKDYSESNFTRARWVLVQGENGEGGKAGVLMMSNPANHDHPEKLRTWDPGTHNGAIFINFNPVQVEPWTMRPGKEYVRLYRLFVFDGSLDAGEAEKLWQMYASLKKIESRLLILKN